MTRGSSKAGMRRGRSPRPAISGVLSVLLLMCALQQGRAEPGVRSFDDPMFQRCIDWMLEGTKGALIGNICVDQYDLPPPSLFLCARKVMTGFPSPADQEGCALLFEEQARKVRAGYVK
jgi:hypothetical protein